jgi:hypothetical protein
LCVVAALFLSVVSSAQTSLAQRGLPPESPAQPVQPVQPSPAEPQTESSPVEPPAEPSPDEPPPAPSTATPRVQLGYNLAIDLTATGVLAASLITWGVAIKPT